MRWRFEVPGKLPSLNEYTSANRSNRFMGAKVKKQAETEILASIGANPPRFANRAVDIWMLWVRPDMRTDKDNVCFAKKFIQDALQKAEVIERDSWALCTPHDFGFLVSKANPRTVVIVQDAWEPAPTAEDFAE